MTHDPIAIARELEAALAAHDARGRVEYSGPDHFRAVNEAIERVRDRALIRIAVAGAWPAGKSAIGNDECLRLLRSLA